METLTPHGGNITVTEEDAMVWGQNSTYNRDLYTVTP